MNSNPIGIEGEKFVNQIANDTFLEYWCYPNPKDEKGNQKEICDLLILFKDILILISVKNYQFKGDYDRYFNNTTEKALKQIQGAERKLFGQKDIYIKHPNKRIEKFEKDKYKRVFRIIINLGEGLKFYHPSSYTKSKKHVTIMDSLTWLGITSEMNTIIDLTNYLTERENLLREKEVIMLTCKDDELDSSTHTKFLNRISKKEKNKKEVLISGNELDLLATYINNSNSYPENLKTEEFHGMFFDIDKTWENFKSDFSYKQKKINDKQSYFIDNFVINEIGYDFNKKFFAEKLMSLSRFERRIVSKGFFEFFDKYKNYSKNHYARAFTDVCDFGFIFVKYPYHLKGEFLENILNLTIESFAIHTNYLKSDYILIAYEDDFKNLVYTNRIIDKPFDKKLEIEIMKDAKSLGWFSDDFNYRKINEKEY